MRISAILSILILCAVSVGCASNIKTDRDRVASAALTYESVLDGLTTARKSGLLDDEAYKKIDPVVDATHAILKALKARVDAGESVSDTTIEQMDRLLDTLLDVLLEYGNSQSRIDAVRLMKHEIQKIRETAVVA